MLVQITGDVKQLSSNALQSSFTLHLRDRGNAALMLVQTT
jgi:hypothetical protein